MGGREIGGLARSPGQTARRRLLEEGVGILSALLATLVLLRWLAAPLWRSMEAFPPIAGDFWFASFGIKGILEQGWYPIHSADYGFPFDYDSFAFPSPDAFHFLLIKAIGLGGGGWLATIKVFYLAGFFLSTAVGYVAFRMASIGRVLAICGAVLFACVSYSFLRVNHLFLASTVSIPAAFIALLYVWRGLPSWFDGTVGRTQRNQMVLFACCLVLIGTAGLYYAFFTCFFLCVVGSSIAWRNGSIRAAVPALVGIAVIGSIVFVQLLPSLQQRHEEGENFSLWKRSFEQTEESGWKLAQAFLPVGGHRVEAFAATERRYSERAPLVNENASVSLGILGSIGFALSLMTLVSFAIKDQGGRRDALDLARLAGLLNLSSALYATVGGFAVLFSFFVTPEIRGVNRISGFISFFSLICLACYGQKWLNRRPRAGFVFSGLVLLATVAGAWDQIPLIRTEASIAKIEADRSFFALVSERVAPGTTIFQLPYHPFPEGGRLGDFEDYEHVKPALFAPSMRWSQPTFRGREGDIWNREVSSLATRKMIDALARAGFAAVLVDFRGYGNARKQWRADFEEALGTAVVEEANGHRAIWRLPAPAAPPNRPVVLSPFRVTTVSTPSAEKPLRCNVDAFNDGPVPGRLEMRSGRRSLFAGWSLAGLEAPDSLELVAIGDSQRWSAPAFVGSRRTDVPIALPGADAFAGFMVYTISDAIPTGDYRLELHASRGGQASVCPLTTMLRVGR